MAGQGGPPGDDEPEIVVQATPQKQRRPRTPNPAVDDVIHTGEIQSRSLIIKSNPSMPRIDAEIAKVEIQDEKTDLAPPPEMPEVAPPRQMPPPRPAAPAHRRLRLGWLLAAVGAAGAAGAMVLLDNRAPAVVTTASGEPSTAALQTAAQFIGTTFDGEAKATMARAEAIASNPMLRAGVETDAQTLADMARDSDVTFPIKGAEVVEVFQIRDGVRTSLLRLPKTAATLQPPATGKTKLVATENEVIVVADAAIANRSAGKASAGEIALAVPVDLAAVKKHVAPSVTGASLVGLGTSVVLVPNPSGAGTHVKVPIETEGKAPLTLDATVAAAAPTAVAGGSGNSLRIVRYAFFGLAGLMLLVFLGTSARRSS